MSKKKLIICTKGKTCRKLGAKDVYCRLEEEIENLGVGDKIKIKKSECLGWCGRGPAIKIKNQKLTYGRVTPKDAKDIIRSLVDDRPVDHLRIKK